MRYSRTKSKKKKKKKVHSTGDEAHYKYIFEMGAGEQTKIQSDIFT